MPLYSPAPVGVDVLASGQATLPRWAATGAVATMSSGLLRLAYFTSTKTETVNNIRVVVAGTAAGATPTLIRFGLYSVAADSALALIGSTANDTTLLAATNTAYTKALSAGVQLSAGVRYALGVLVVTGAAAPLLFSSSAALVAGELAVAPRLSALLSAQADLPASATDASLTGSTAMVYGAILP